MDRVAGRGIRLRRLAARQDLLGRVRREASGSAAKLLWTRWRFVPSSSRGEVLAAQAARMPAELLVRVVIPSTAMTPPTSWRSNTRSMTSETTQHCQEPASRGLSWQCGIPKGRPGWIAAGRPQRSRFVT
jgi:hypothetical protein